MFDRYDLTDLWWAAYGGYLIAQGKNGLGAFFIALSVIPRPWREAVSRWLWAGIESGWRWLRRRHNPYPHNRIER